MHSAIQNLNRTLTIDGTTHLASSDIVGLAQLSGLACLGLPIAERRAIILLVVLVSGVPGESQHLSLGKMMLSTMVG